MLLRKVISVLFISSRVGTLFVGHNKVTNMPKTVPTMMYLLNTFVFY